MDPKSIQLTETEQVLRRLLLDVVEFIEKNPDPAIKLEESIAKQPLQLRWSGGWVRDKLLSKESDDIDVAINKMTGYDFALKLKQYLDDVNNQKKYHFGNHKLPKLHKIDANPDKSKHLETTTTSLFGLDIDLVNLRKETYTEDSRNPQVEFGTPQEDALRRDATINAMFYNIHSQAVEDLTNHGLEDLASGIIRTPLEPRQTFLDDPLRVLRLLRFSSRFGYSIEQKTQDAMKEDDIKRALMLKISRERVLAEFDKMFKGRDPRGSLELVDTIGLYDCVFVDPSNPDFYTPDLTNWKHVYDELAKIITSKSDLKTITLDTKEEIYYAWILAAMVPLADAAKVPVKKKEENWISRVGQEGMKFPSRTVALLSHSKDHMEEIKNTVKSKAMARDSLGMLIRKWGATWKAQVLFAMFHDILISPGETKSIIARYESFLVQCQQHRILEAYDFKPLIDGTNLAKALNTKPGPWMKEALDVVMAWQLRNPDVTDIAVVLSEVEAWKKDYDDNLSAPATKHKKGELTSDLISHFLHLTLRPIFSQAQQHPDLTSTGRLNINAEIARKSQRSLIGDELPPWRSQQSWALQLLQWCCLNIDTANVEKEWGFLIPPVLTVLDSLDVQTKAQGCTLLRLVLQQTPPKLLQRTGLEPVFKESLYTCTTYLPNLTEPKDSVMILKEAIPALMALATTTNPEPSPSRTKAYLEILRKGILAPLDHASEHVVVAEQLYKELPYVLSALQVESVVQLKDLVPRLSAVLDEPLGLAYPPLLETALNCLQSLMKHARPRVWFWRFNILNGVCGLWLRMNSLDSEKVIEITPEMERVRACCVSLVHDLDDAVNDSKWAEDTARESWPEDLEKVQNTDERFKELFAEL